MYNSLLAIVQTVLTFPGHCQDSTNLFQSLLEDLALRCNEALQLAVAVLDDGVDATQVWRRVLNHQPLLVTVLVRQRDEAGNHMPALVPHRKQRHVGYNLGINRTSCNDV